MNYERGLGFLGAYNRLAIAPAVQTSVNRLAVAPPPTKDDLLGPGASAPATTTTTMVRSPYMMAPKPKAGSGMFDVGGGGSRAPEPSPAPAEEPAAVGAGLDLERPTFEPEPEPSGPSGGGGGGGGFEPAAFRSGGAPRKTAPSATTTASASKRVPTWAIAVGGGVALALGALVVFRKRIFR